MTIEGVDYSTARPRIADLAKAGKRFACRYLSNSTSGKNLSLTEAKALAAGGLWIVSNWEWRAGDAKSGRAKGVEYATEARKQAIACGMPATRPIYFSVDFDPASNDWPAIEAYFTGITSVLGTAGTGVYGGYRTIERAVSGGWCDWYWQTYAWSGGRWHPSAHIQQYRNGVTLAGGDVDLDRATVADYGQWKPGITPTQEDDMDATERQWLKDIWYAMFTDDASGRPAGSVTGKVETIRAQVTAQPAAIDYDKLADALLRRVLTTLQG